MRAGCYPDQLGRSVGHTRRTSRNTQARGGVHANKGHFKYQHAWEKFMTAVQLGDGLTVSPLGFGGMALTPVYGGNRPR